MQKDQKRHLRNRVNLLSVILILLLLSISVANSTAAPSSEDKPGFDVMSFPLPPSTTLSTDGMVTVTGRLTYVDIDGNTQPAASAHVTVLDWDDSVYRGEPLAETVTDQDGFYTAAGIDNQDYDGGNLDQGQDIYIDVRTQSPQVKLLNGNTRQPFVLSSRERPAGFHQDVSDGQMVTVDLQARADNQVDQSMQIYQALRAGWEFLPEKPNLSGPLQAQWGMDSSEGSYYMPGDRIYYDGNAVNFPQVILHHFAHALAWELHNDVGYSSDCFPSPDDHTFNLRTGSSARCAWIEGWAVAFSMMALNDPVYHTPAAILDMEAPDAGAPGWADGDIVAGRVAGALWDLFDDIDDGLDTYTPGGNTPEGRFVRIWGAYSARSLATTADFWDAYLVSDGHVACSALKALFQNTINYNTPPELDPFPDPIEMDENPEPPPSFDMTYRARDAECAFERLIFDIEEPDSGISLELDDEGFLHIIPEQNWNGEVTASVRVSDGIDFTVQLLHIIVHNVNGEATPSPTATPATAPLAAPVYLPLVLKDHPPASTIAGRVTDGAGAPVAGAAISVSGPVNASTTTASDGRYAFRLPAGTYNVSVAKAGYISPAPRTVRIPPSVTNVDFVLRRPAATPTRTPRPTRTPVPTSTARPTRTRTPIPTATDTPPPTYTPVPEGRDKQEIACHLLFWWRETYPTSYPKVISCVPADDIFHYTGAVENTQYDSQGRVTGFDMTATFDTGDTYTAYPRGGEYNGNGQTTSYEAEVSGSYFDGFQQRLIGYTYDRSGQWTGATVEKDYADTGESYRVEIEACRPLGSLTGYRAEVYGGPFNGDEVIIGQCD